MPPSPPTTDPAGAIASPCIALCRYDADRGWCLGCGRTLDEIGGWSTATDTARHAIVATAAIRLLET